MSNNAALNNAAALIEAAETILDPRKRTNSANSANSANPTITCACGCGQTFPQFDEWKRPRRFISGHNANQASSFDRILAYLRENGPTRRGDLAKALGRKPDNLDKSLWWLRDRGQVVNVAHGVWALHDDPKPRPKPRPTHLVELAEVAAQWGRGWATDEQLTEAAKAAAEVGSR